MGFKKKKKTLIECASSWHSWPNHHPAPGRNALPLSGADEGGEARKDSRTP